MQQPDGTLRQAPEETLRALKAEMEAATGKPHPIFREGEVLEIKGGKWKVASILKRGRMVLKAVPY